MMYMWIFAVAICTAFIIGYQCNMIRGNLKKLIPIGGMIALIDICCIMMFMVRNTIKISVVVLLAVFLLDLCLIIWSRVCAYQDYIWQHAWKLFARVWFILTPIITFFLMEWISNADQFNIIAIKYRLIDIAILILLFMVLDCFSFSRKMAVVIFYVTGIIFSVANYYVTLIRGENSILPSELFAIRTVANVSSGYTLEFTKEIMLPLFVAVVCSIIGIWSAGYDANRVNWKKRMLVGASAILVVIGAYKKIDVFNGYYNVKLYYWQLKESYGTYGIPLTFWALCQNNRVKEPDDYSVERVREIYDICSSEGEKLKSDEKRPTVIAIMNETWSDLSVIRKFESAPDYMAFWHDFDEPILKGNLLVSVHGGGTCNSEFEFLTGASMGNLPQGVYPYQQYSLKSVSSLPREFKKLGYDTIAIHPGNAVSWNRNKAFIDLGFDRFLSEDDFENPERLRYFISDRSCYDKIIDEFEKKKTEEFIFAVTIQNHGSYDEVTFSDDNMVQIEDDLAEYTNAREYLTLLKIADEALADLFAYFEQVEEPVIICVFGDHQPFLGEEFYEKLYGHSTNELSLEEREKKYLTPYLIWANYDTSMEQSRKNTSANFLGAQLLKTAGALENPFYKYLYSMQQEIVEMNADFYRTKDGVLRVLEDGNNDWLKNYQKTQYYELFDK